MLIGYMRVSKADGSQTVDLQRDALTEAGVDPAYLYEDRASGGSDDRPGLTATLKALRPGDTLVVWKLDRLGRDLRHLVNTVHGLTQGGGWLQSANRAWSIHRYHDTGRQAGFRHFCSIGGIRARSDNRTHPRRSCIGPCAGAQWRGSVQDDRRQGPPGHGSDGAAGNQDRRTVPGIGGDATDAVSPCWAGWLGAQTGAEAFGRRASLNTLAKRPQSKETLLNHSSIPG